MVPLRDRHAWPNSPAAPVSPTAAMKPRAHTAAMTGSLADDREQGNPARGPSPLRPPGGVSLDERPQHVRRVHDRGPAHVVLERVSGLRREVAVVLVDVDPGAD